MTANKYIRNSIVVVFFIAIAILAYRLTINREHTPNLLKVLETRLHHIEKQAYELLADSSLIYKAGKQKLSDNEIIGLNNATFDIYVYLHGDLQFWSDNKFVPDNRFYYGEEGSFYADLPQGIFEIIKSDYILHNDTFEVFISILLKKKYPIQNVYLQNELNEDLGVFGNAELLESCNDIGFETVKTINGQPLFKVKVSDIKSNQTHNLIVILWLIILILSYVLLYYLIGILHKHIPDIINFVLALTGLVIIKIIFANNIPDILTDHLIFSPVFYASNIYGESLFVLFLNVLTFLNGAFFFYKNINLKENNKYQHIIKVISISIIFLFTYWFTDFIRSLVFDSKFDFSPTSFVKFNIENILFIFSIGFILLGYYLLSFRLLSVFQELKNKNIVTFLIIIVICFIVAIWQPVFSIGLWAGIYLLILFYVIKQIKKGNYSLGFIGLILYFSSFTGYYIFQFKEAKEQDNFILFSNKILSSKDPIAEYLFINMLGEPERKMTDSSSNPDNDKTNIRDFYLSRYLKKYEIIISGLNDELREYLHSIISGTNTHFEKINEYLFFYNGCPSPSQTVYLGYIPIKEGNSQIDTLIIKLNSKLTSSVGIYPELLLENNINKENNQSDFDYGLYCGGEWVKRINGHLVFNIDTLINHSGNYFNIKENGHNYFINKSVDGKIVILNSTEDYEINSFALISFLFFYFIIISIAIYLGLILLAKKILSDRGLVISKLTLRDKISFATLLLIIFIFFIVGGFTIQNVKGEYDEYHNERLARKSQSVLTAIEYIVSKFNTLANTEDLRMTLNPEEISNLSDIHSIDINLYDEYGLLKLTSQPDIFKEKLLSPYIDYEAMNEIRSTHSMVYMKSEHIGKFEYLSAYFPIINFQNKIIGYVNLPYFAKEKDLEIEIASFLSGLINIYVFSILLAGIMAILIAGYMTEPLRLIRYKMQQISIGSKNDLIEWDSKDEVGMLVDEYNKMIVELENSAVLLAKSERESAWRDMAKQVAHEIKNPLTPMKLNLQHLQKAVNDKKENISELVKKVSSSLIDQINTLANIASEFSNFAQMPKPKQEKIALNNLVIDTTNLYNDLGNIELKITEETLYILGDKEQLIRILNNLIRNAFQSIPKERSAMVKVELEKRGEEAVILVKDNGSGISEKDKLKVFIPSFTTKTSGTGIGLAMTKEMIVNMNGKIEFESTENIGTTFSVSLPLV